MLSCGCCYFQKTVFYRIFRIKEIGKDSMLKIYKLDQVGSYSVDPNSIFQFNERISERRFDI